MSLTITKDGAKVDRISRNLGILTGAIAFDSSYPTGGELITDISKYFKTILQCMFDPNGGYNFEFDKSNNTVLVRIGPHTHTFKVKDATSGGVALESSRGLVGASGAGTPFLCSVTAASTRAEFRLESNLGHTHIVDVKDNDGSEAGETALYYDDDATNVNERILCVNPEDRDRYIMCEENYGHSHKIKITDDDNAATAGIALTLDDNGTHPDRLLCQNANNADVEDNECESSCSFVEIPNTANLTALTAVRFLAIGLI